MLLATLGSFSNLNKTAGVVYTQRGFSLAAYRGQTVRVQFRATTDASPELPAMRILPSG